MKKHELLNGQVVDLRKLGERESAFVRDLERMARQGVSYFEVYRAAVGPGSPALSGRMGVDRAIVESALYRVARDIAARVGIRQRLILAPESEPLRAKAPRDSSMMSVLQAAELIGISRAAVYKAVNRATLKAIRIGNVTVVERASVKAYRDARLRKGPRAKALRRRPSGHRRPSVGSHPASAAP